MTIIIIIIMTVSSPLVHILARWESVALSDSDGGGEENYSGVGGLEGKGKGG